MRVWTAYEPRDPASAQERADRTVFVKDGFSWIALFFPLPWLLLNRLWLGTLIYVALSVAAAFIGEFLPVTGGAGALLALIGNLYAGFEGNDLIRRKLLRKNFVHAGSVVAKAREEAELLFFASRGTADPVVHTPVAPVRPNLAVPRPAPSDVLGLFPRPEGSR